MIRRASLVAILATTLAACATIPTSDPEPVVVTKEVKVPVPVPCAGLAKLGSEPGYPDGDAALNGAPDIFQMVKLLMAGRALRMQRLNEYLAARAACE